MGSLTKMNSAGGTFPRTDSEQAFQVSIQHPSAAMVESRPPHPCKCPHPMRRHRLLELCASHLYLPRPSAISAPSPNFPVRVIAGVLEADTVVEQPSSLRQPWLAARLGRPGPAAQHYSAGRQSGSGGVLEPHSQRTARRCGRIEPARRSEGSEPRLLPATLARQPAERHGISTSSRYRSQRRICDFYCATLGADQDPSLGKIMLQAAVLLVEGEGRVLRTWPP